MVILIIIKIRRRMGMISCTGRFNAGAPVVILFVTLVIMKVKDAPCYRLK